MPKSLIIERLDGSKMDGMYILQSPHEDIESFALPADTAVLHIAFS